MNVLFIVPCYNAEKNIENLALSLLSQTNSSWHCIIIDDMSEDNLYEKSEKFRKDKFSIIKNKEKKYALKNIVDSARMFQHLDDVIIAVVDGDDSLCNNNTVSILIDQYKKGSDVVWTAHKWDINGMNISKPLPEKVDPYSWGWCSSHLRTFKSSIIKSIPDKNFIDTSGNWFTRGYDQALMLPVLKISKKRTYVPEVCYLYNIKSVSIKNRSWEERNQLSTINIVRSRGFLD